MHEDRTNDRANVCAVEIEVETDDAARPSASREDRLAPALDLAHGTRARAVLDEAELAHAWRGMFFGRWSLVAQLESGGHRYLIARRRRHAEPAGDGLTPAETQCAMLLAKGRSPKAIAYELHISASTTSHHLRRAMQKLGVTRRAELAVAFGVRR